MPKWAADVKEGRMRQAVRRYRNPNRHDNAYVYRSVTNVTGALPKPALMYWYAKLTAETAVNEQQAWINMATDEDKIAWLKGAPQRNVTRAAAKGTTVHAVIDNMLQGKTYEVESKVEPWIASVIKFVNEARPRPERTETSIYDERTLCAGTFDFLGRLDAAPEFGRCLIDWKTSAGIYEDMAVQLVGGYALGAQYILDDDAREIDWREPDTALLVHFTPNGYEIRRVPKDVQLRRAFLGALEIRKWEDDGQQIEKPYQLQLDVHGPSFDKMPSSQEWNYLRARLQELSTEQQLSLSWHAKELGIETKRSEMTCDDYDKLLSMLNLDEFRTAVSDAQEHHPSTSHTESTVQGRTLRPMP
jgi:hypothetical protein